VCVFAPKADVPAAFLRSTIEPQLAHIEATETATTVIHLGKGDIDRFAALVPSSGVMAAFAVVADPLYSRIVANKQTARTLATLRDTLLPRLISGQLRLPEAEAIFEPH
jgi:type I restriction enzyme S subunit